MANYRTGPSHVFSRPHCYKGPPQWPSRRSESKGPEEALFIAISARFAFRQLVMGKRRRREAEGRPLTSSFADDGREPDVVPSKFLFIVVVYYVRLKGNYSCGRALWSDAFFSYEGVSKELTHRCHFVLSYWNCLLLLDIVLVMDCIRRCSGFRFKITTDRVVKWFWWCRNLPGCANNIFAKFRRDRISGKGMYN